MTAQNRMAIEWYERRENRDKKERSWDVPVRELLFEDTSAKIRCNRILDGGDPMAYIHRTLEQKIMDISRDYSCLLLIGPRQVGKTTMSENLPGRTEHGSGRH